MTASPKPTRKHDTRTEGSIFTGYRASCSCGWVGSLFKRAEWSSSDENMHLKQYEHRLAAARRARRSEPTS